MIGGSTLKGKSKHPSKNTISDNYHKILGKALSKYGLVLNGSKVEKRMLLGQAKKIFNKYVVKSNGFNAQGYNGGFDKPKFNSFPTAILKKLAVNGYWFYLHKDGNSFDRVKDDGTSAYKVYLQDRYCSDNCHKDYSEVYGWEKYHTPIYYHF